MSGETLLWIGFIVGVSAILIIDLGMFHRRPHAVSIREALAWWGVWVALALLFNVGVYFTRGTDAALEFFTAYLIEESLSVDNLFVFLLIFSYFQVPPQYQHKVLFWGIVGAVVMRALFIVAGITLIERFHWIIYLFGAFLIVTGLKMLRRQDEDIHPERNPVLRLFRRWMPVTSDYEGARFFVKREGRRFATPMFIVLLLVETTDVMFALDSIPAVLAITRDPMIVYTSNVFAILGLRAIYFALSGLLYLFHYLQYGLALILAFIGAKMLLSGVLHIPVTIALGVVAGVLVVSIVASLIRPRQMKSDAAGHDTSSS